MLHIAEMSRTGGWHPTNPSHRSQQPHLPTRSHTHLRLLRVLGPEVLQPEPQARVQRSRLLQLRFLDPLAVQVGAAGPLHTVFTRSAAAPNRQNAVQPSAQQRAAGALRARPAALGGGALALLRGEAGGVVPGPEWGAAGAE